MRFPKTESALARLPRAEFFSFAIEYNYKMEVYFTEKEKKVELAPQPQLDVFDLMAQPIVVPA